MHHLFGRFVAATLVAAFALLTWSTAVQAAPAIPDVVKTFTQPDGTKLRLKLWGDEFRHGYETLGGHTVLYDSRDRTFKYAERTPTGDLRHSGRVVGRDDPGSSRGLRPAPAVIAAARRREEVLPIGPLQLNVGAPAWAGSDTDVLFLAVEFSDTECEFTPTQHENNMFGGAATGPGDLDDYYREISRDNLELDGEVVGSEDGLDCIELPETKAYYDTPETDRDDDLVRAAITAADPYVDFDRYDNDDDGQVDALGIIYAGGGAHDGCYASDREGRLWPHSGSINSGGLPPIADFNVVERYILNSEVTHPLPETEDTICDQIQTIGLFAHEFGHSLGLPDLYDTDSGDAGGSGVSVWSAMASQYLGTVNNSDTPPHFDPWSKAVLGWVSPQEHAPGDVFQESLGQILNGGEVHQFFDNLGGFEDSETGTGDYFLVENRQKVGFDAQLPGCGVLVWHIDEAMDNNRSNDHRRVDVEQADGQFDLNDNDGADDGDPFPGSSGKRLFANDTTPDSKHYDGSDSGFQMRVQTGDCGAQMPVLFGVNSPPVADAGGDYTTPEGTKPILDGTNSSDPDGDEITHRWEWSGGSTDFDDATGPTPEYPLVSDDVDEKVIGLRVFDEWDQIDTDAAKVTVTNVAPSIDELDVQGVRQEGTELTFALKASDPGWADELSMTIDFGDGGGPQPVAATGENDEPKATLQASVPHAYGDNGLYTVEVCATDDDGGVGCQQTLLNIANVAPTITQVAGDTTRLENQEASVTALVTDAGWLDDLSATIDWGDGSGPQPLAGERENDRPDATLELSAEHVYGDNGTFTVAICANDDDGGSAGCPSFDVVVSNVDPDALIDKGGAVVINGIPTLLAEAGAPLAVEGRVQDPGSDDETARWTWDDGSTDTVTKFRVDPLFDDALPSPSVNPRDILDAQSHAFTACLYDVGFSALDDDAGASPIDTVKVLVVGNADTARQSGYWAHQYRGNGRIEHSQAILACYLEVGAYVSRVFDEARDASTFDRAQKILFAQGSSVSKLDQLDRDLLTAWLNFANGAVGYDEQVDTNGDGAADTAFHVALEAAEDVRLDPAATPAQIDAQRVIVNRINDTV